jgi:serine/threonine-protein kinase
VWEGARRCRACGAALPLTTLELGSGGPGSARTQPTPAFSPSAPTLHAGGPPSTPTVEEEARALVGRRLGGKFVLREFIGAGASGFVYRADQVTLGRTVAIKVLRPHLSSDAELVRRFHQEALAASRLNHPGVVSVIDYGQTEDGHLYIVMEYLRGRTVTQLLRAEAPLAVNRVVGLMCQVLEALDEAHASGVVHADLKADNIVVETLRGGGDLVKVVDFGIARIVEGGAADLTAAASAGDGSGQGDAATAASAARLVCGTPEYMAPEVIVGGPTTPAADQYGAGVVLFELLTGQTPFAGGGTMNVLTRHVQTPVPTLGEVSPALAVPVAIETAMHRALAKLPEERFASVLELRAALLAAIVDDSGRAPLPGWPRLGTETGPEPTRPCPSCGAKSPARFKFCPECGERWAESPLDLAAALTRDTVRWAPVVRPVSMVPFVGRAREQAEVAAFISGAGGASTMILVGAAGSGRSRLVRQACADAAQAGTFVTIAGADPTGLEAPWYPVRAAVAAILQLPSVCDLDTLASRLEAVGLSRKEAPGVAELLGFEASLSELEPAVRRREATAAALSVLRAASARAPRAVLVFEDSDRYDRMSHDLLMRLVEHPADAAVRVLVTTTLEHDPHGHQPVARLALGGLDADALTPMVAALTSAQSPAASAGVVAELSHGLALHAEHAVRWCVEGGEIGSIPAGLADLIAARVDLLSGRARIVLQAIAAGGEEILRPLLEQVVNARGVGAGELDQALERLAAHGFVEVDDELISIGHRFVREVVLDATPADVRRALHEVYAQLLDSEQVRSALRGHHLELCGDDSAAVPHLLAAGDEAIRGFDDHGAAVWYRRALDAARRGMGGLDDDLGLADVLTASVKLADALRTTGELVLARGIIEEALARSDGRTKMLEAQLRRALGHVALAQGMPERAFASLRCAVGVAMGASNLELVAALYLDLATVHARGGHPAEALRELQEGIDVVTLGEGVAAKEGPRALWRMSARLGELLHATGRRREALLTTTHALRHAQRVGAALGRARVNTLLAFMYEQERDLPAATRHRQAAVDELRRMGDRRTTHDMLAARAATGQFQIELDGLDLTPLEVESAAG